MKNIVTILITALLFIYTPVLQAQIHKDTDVDEFIDDGDGKPIDIGDIIAGNPCNNVECENIPNIRFQFTGGSLFDGAVQNEINIRRAAEREANRWYDKQISIAKSFIDRKYGKNFVSFNAAKNELFNETEIPAIKRLTDDVRREKSRSKGRRTAARLKHLDQFRSLRVRKQEIKTGLINTNYPYKKVNGISLGSLKTNADITREYNKLVTAFKDNKWREFQDGFIIELTGTPLTNEMAKLKNGYFSSLNKWNRLDYLQFLIFFEEFKKQSTPPYALNPELSRIFNSYIDKVEFSTQPRVDAFIAANQNKELSIFHPDYWIKLVNNTQTWISSDVRILKAKAAHQGLMDRELDRLAGAPLNATHSIDNLVKEISLRNPYQVQWLNDHPNKAPEFMNRINEAIKKDNEGEFGNDPNNPLDIVISGGRFHYNFTVSSIEGEINKGIAAATLIYELGITDSNRKKWLYNNIETASELTPLLTQNNFSLEAKKITKDLIEFYKILSSPREIKSTGKFPEELNSCCPGNCCPDRDYYQEDRIMMEFGVKPIRAAIDGTFNNLASIVNVFRSNEKVGRAIKSLMKELNIDVPDDVSNERLAEIFRIRKRDGILIIEYKPGLLRSMLDIGLDTLDMVSILSPSKGGGAFLAVKSGGRVTITNVTRYLRNLSRGEWKTVNESMSDAAKSYQEFITKRKWNESFVIDNVKFDGVENGILLDAKSGMLNFVNSDGTFKPFFSKIPQIIDQARRQRIAANDLPIEWHFEHEKVRLAFEKLLEPLNLDIIFIHKPR